MIVVSDTSVLVNLAWLNHLDILPTLYGEVTIPTAVWEEIVVSGAGKVGSHEIAQATWVKHQQPTNTSLINSLRQALDIGEAEGIALALELDADLLLIDERLGRMTAKYFDLEIIGLLGILVQAKQEGLVDQIKPLLDQLRFEIGFRISKQLYQEVLRLAQE
ncbi:MAG: DUF3368 domain-containing protein [Anaerolineales bacterium]|nr:DUF3368 domain-containing protein [Anaerolineales bacterium]